MNDNNDGILLYYLSIFVVLYRELYTARYMYVYRGRSGDGTVLLRTA